MLVKDDRYADGEVASGAITASTTAAIDGQSGPFAQLLPYYLVAVAAGVTVFLITKFLGKKG